jgi:outer membrane protein assembly factor BamB
MKEQRILLVLAPLLVVGLAAGFVPHLIARASGQATVTSVLPASGAVGTKVLIKGSGFTGATSVLFGGAPATFHVISDTKVGATVPWNALSGEACVQAPVALVCGGPFQVTLGVALSRTEGPPGSTVEASGTGFGPNDPILITLDGQQQLGETQTGTSGGFAPVRIAMPLSIPSGQHTIDFTDHVNGVVYPALFVIFVDWPQFHYDASHTGYNPLESSISPSTASALKLRWSATLSSSPISQRSSPVLASGIAFLGIPDGHVFGLDAANGFMINHASIAVGQYPTSVAVANNRFFFGADNKLYAVSVSNSASYCTYTASEGPIEDAPTVVGTTVYFTTIEGTLYAVDGTNCALLWSTSVGAYVFMSGLAASVTVANVPSLGGEVLFVGDAQGVLHAYSATTHAQLWSFTTGGSVVVAPVVNKGAVYFDDGYGNVYALNATNGAKLWGISLGATSAMTSTPALAKGILYFGSADILNAVNATTGAILWTFSTGNIILSSPAVVNGVVFFGSADDNVYAVDATTGAKLWSHATGGAIASSPVVANGMVLVGSDDGKVYAFQ